MTEKFDFADRLKRLREKISSENIDGVLISKPANLFYFSGFRGDSTVLIVTENSKILITDGRYTEQAKIQAADFEIIRQTEGLFKQVEETIKNSGIKILGIEGRFMSVAAYNHLKGNLPEVELKSVELDPLRQIKDSAEISLIRRACEIADKAFSEILKFIRPGIRENEVAARLEYLMRIYGAEKNSFDTIVASGVRGSLPHGIATDKVINFGELVTMDFGAIYKGYCSDMTRTVAVGKIPARLREIYDAVLNAQKFGLEVIKPKKSGKACDEEVREKIKAAGFEEYFIHSLGHGLGIEVHEEPRLSRLSTCESLEPNMLVTDEPGIYVADLGGVRIEDTCLVTDSGVEALTKSPKDLIEL